MKGPFITQFLASTDMDVPSLWVKFFYFTEGYVLSLQMVSWQNYKAKGRGSAYETNQGWGFSYTGKRELTR